jgi:hypothetical protein
MLSPLFVLMLVQAPALEPGATVRVAAPQVAAAPIVGRVEITDQDIMWIAPSGGGAVVRVPWSAVTALEVRHRSDGVATGFAAGAIAGGIVTIGALQRELRRDHSSQLASQLAAAIKAELKGVLWGTVGATAGGLLGAAIGSRFGSERWEPVHVGIGPVVTGSGVGLGAGVRIAF